MTASLHGPKFQFGFPFSLLNLPHLLAPGLRAQVMLPGLLPESPTPIKAIFFKQLSQLSNPSQWWTNPKKWIWKARYLPYSALTLTSPCPVLDGWLSCTALCPHHQSTYSADNYLLFVSFPHYMKEGLDAGPMPVFPGQSRAAGLSTHGNGWVVNDGGGGWYLRDVRS